MKRCAIALTAAIAATAAHNGAAFLLTVSGLAKLREDAPEMFAVNIEEFNAHIAEIAAEMGYPTTKG